MDRPYLGVENIIASTRPGPADQPARRPFEHGRHAQSSCTSGSEGCERRQLRRRRREGMSHHALPLVVKKLVAWVAP
eukprot:483650-Amorphochlora_amoeboformis.AAC.1